MRQWFAERDKLCFCGGVVLLALLLMSVWGLLNLPGTTHWEPLTETSAYIIWGLMGFCASGASMAFGATTSGSDRILTSIGIIGALVSTAAMFYGLWRFTLGG